MTLARKHDVWFKRLLNVLTRYLNNVQTYGQKLHNWLTSIEWHYARKATFAFNDFCAPFVKIIASDTIEKAGEG